MTQRFGSLLPLPDVDSAPIRNFRAAMHLSEHLHEAPILLPVCGLRDTHYDRRGNTTRASE